MGTCVPTGPSAWRRDVVTEARRKRDGIYSLEGKGRGKGSEIRSDPFEHGLIEGDEIHLVDGEKHMTNAEKIRDDRMPARLVEESFAGVDEQDREIRI